MIITEPFEGIYMGENVEEELEAYMENLMNYTNGQPYIPVDRKYERVTYPDDWNVSLKGGTFANYTSKKKGQIVAFWKDQDRRMRDGHEGMSGLYYGYFNFHRFGNKKAPRPAFRRNDWELFWLLDACIYGDNEYFQGYERWGVNEIGRRRSGKTEKLGWLTLHVMRTEKNSIIIVTSKTEKDAQEVIIGQKIKFSYDRLPLPIKPSELKTNAGMIHLAVQVKDEDGNRQTMGRNTKVMAVPPKETSAEGQTLWGWIHDEQGKTPNLQTLFSNTIEALNDAEGLDRDGFVYLTGVAGDFDKMGTDAITLWDTAKVHRMINWFTAGWVGLCVDKFGNEDIREGVRRILTKRNEIWTNTSLPKDERNKQLLQMQQKFPLTVEEALQVSVGVGRFDIHKIQGRLKKLHKDPPNIITGDVSWTLKGLISEFTPNEFGRLQLIEMPRPGHKYIVGVDAYGMKQADHGSDGAAWIFKLKTGLSPLQVAHTIDKLKEAESMREQMEIHLSLGHIFTGYYSGRNPDPTEFAEDVAAICRWVHRLARLPQEEKVKALIETAPSVIINHMKKFYRDITMNAPIKPGETPTKKMLTEKFGIEMKEYWREASLGELAHYFSNYMDNIYWISLLEKAKTYNSEIPARKWDDIDGAAVTMVAVTDPRTEMWVKKRSGAGNKRRRLVSFNRSS